MSTLDAIAPSFRRAKDRWPGATNLISHYNSLAATHAGNQHGLIELIKSFIEAVCLTILLDHGQSEPTDVKTTGLLTLALEQLGMSSTHGATRFDKVLSAHNQLAEALTHVRNHEGPVAHGKDGYLDVLAENHVRVYLLSADAILTLILGALDGAEPNLQHTREPYERFEHLHRRIDGAIKGCTGEWEEEDKSLVLRFSTEVLEDIRVSPSQLLFHLDRTAYVAVLQSQPSVKAVEAPSIAHPELPSLEAGRVQRAVDLATVDGSYSGHLEGLAEGLRAHLTRLLPPPHLLSEEQQPELVSSLLADFSQLAGVDWKQRETIRSRLLTAFKRRLRTFGLEDVTPMAQQVLEWLEQNTEDPVP